METKSDIFRTLRNPYATVQFQNTGLFRTQGIIKSLPNMQDDHAYLEHWHSQNSLLRYFQRYLGIFSDIGAYSATLTGTELSRGAKVSPALFETEIRF